jgi:hypothetical protein
VVKVLALPAHLLVCLGEQFHRLATARAPRLATGHPPLGFPESAFGFAVVPRILHDIPVRSDEEHLEAHINPGVMAGLWKRLRGDVGT